MLYLLLICYDRTTPPTPGQSNLQPEHHKLELELRETGQYVSGGALWPVEGCKNVQRVNGALVVTDGPFAESKEALGGYYLVDCDDEEAVRIAGRLPVDARSWVQVRALPLFHPNTKRIAGMKDF